MFSCGRTGGPEAGPIEIVAATDATSSNTLVRVTGLSGAELRALSAGAPGDELWPARFRISVSDSEIAVAGRYVVTPTAVEFHPSFPFDPGRRYSATFEPQRLPTPRRDTTVRASIVFDAPARSPSTTVTGIFPSADVWPENMLRFYIHFSGPMSRGQGTKHVHLVDDRGAEVADAILAAYADLWDPDATRLTVFFDPGRVKRGVGPNVAMGRAIVVGRRYAIVVDPEWHDAHGQPLKDGFRREFVAGPPAYLALNAHQWRISSPRRESRDPLVVTFPAPLDHALIERAIGLESPDGVRLTGQAVTGAAETTWTFTPGTRWMAGRHQIVALTLLEDPAGNKIGRAFEVLSRESSGPESPDPEIVRVPFEIR